MKKLITLIVVLSLPVGVFGQVSIQYLYVDDSCRVDFPDYRDSVLATDNCCMDTILQEPPPGLVQVPGDEIPVTLTAVDCFGNTAELNFSVFVIDTIPPVFDWNVIPPPTERLRLIVLADPNVDPNKETDDKMSLVRLMAYANEFDIEGIVATCSHNLYARYTEPIHGIIDAYEQVLPNLQKHDSGWPTADYLREVTALGPASYGTQFALDEEPISDGGRLIVNALGVNDDRPIWVAIWGDGAVIAQALEYVRKTQGEQAAQDASSKLRILDNAGQDDSGAWLKAQGHYPDMFYIRWVQGGMAMDPISDERLDWFPFCGECAQGEPPYTTDEWVAENIQIGILGAEYPDRRYLKEGDTPTLLYLLSSEDPMQPHLGSWGGVFTEIAVEGVRSVRDPLGRVDEFTESEFDPYYMHEFVEDTWNGYTSKWAGIFRHWKEFQLDFAERIQWSIE